VRADHEAIEAGVLGQVQLDCGRLAAILASAIEQVTYGTEVQGAAGQGLCEGGVDVLSALGPEQLGETRRGAAQVPAALGQRGEPRLAVGERGVEAIDGAVLLGGALVLGESGDVGGVLDLLTPIPRAQVGAQGLLAVEDAHLVGRREYDERAARVRVRDRVIVEVEADVGVLPTSTAMRSSAGNGLSGRASSLPRSSAKSSRTVRPRSSGQDRSAAMPCVQASAWSLRSSMSVKVRAAKKLSRM
jgi:hypothetical protein